MAQSLPGVAVSEGGSNRRRNGSAFFDYVSTMATYLGIHAGYFSLTATVTDGKHILGQACVAYRKDLSHYFPASTGEEGVVREADPRIWVDALRLALQHLFEDGVALCEISAITGVAQGGGTICVDAFGHLTRLMAPTRHTNSNSAYCRDLEMSLDERLLARTGGKIADFDMVANIRRFSLENPAKYACTARFHSVSSFLCSKLIGGIDAPISLDDASRTHLLNLRERQWDAEMTDGIAPGLLWKLPEPVSFHTVAGHLAPLFSRYGLRPGIPVLVWNSEISELQYCLQATEPGTVALLLHEHISLLASVLPIICEVPPGCGHLMFGIHNLPTAFSIQIHDVFPETSIVERAKVLFQRLQWTGICPEKIRLMVSPMASPESIQRLSRELKLPVELVNLHPGSLSLSSALRAQHILEETPIQDFWARFWQVEKAFLP